MMQRDHYCHCRMRPMLVIK